MYIAYHKVLIKFMRGYHINITYYNSLIPLEFFHPLKNMEYIFFSKLKLQFRGSLIKLQLENLLLLQYIHARRLMTIVYFVLKICFNLSSNECKYILTNDSYFLTIQNTEYAKKSQFVERSYKSRVIISPPSKYLPL